MGRNGHDGSQFDLMSRALSRREFIQRTGFTLGSLSLVGLLSACGSDSDTDEGPGAGVTPTIQSQGSGSTTPAQSSAGDSTAPAASSASGQIVYSSSRDLNTTDPRLIDTTEEGTIIQLINEPLVILDAEMNVVPLLATSWEPLEDTTWQFKLREGVSFHNGEPFNADAVKFTIDEIRRVGEEYPWFYIWGDTLPEAEVVDEHTVNILTEMTVASAPRNLALLGMLPPEAGAQEDFASNLIGTGPYKFIEHQKDVRLELEANPDYWGGPPAVQTIVYRPIPDPSARMSAVQTGEVDIAANIPPDLVEVLRASGDLTVAQVPGVRIAHFPYNFRNVDSPIADVRVRQALTHAIDGESILRDVLAGAGQPLDGPVPSILFAAADLGGYEYDPDKAKALLEEAGYSFDNELVMIFTSGEFIKDQEVTEAIQAMLSDIGVSLRIETLESGAYTERRNGPDWDIALNGLSTRNGNPAFFLTWATGPNFDYPNQEAKDIIAEALETVNEDERAELYQQAQELYWQDAPYLWGYTQTDSVAIRNRVQGLEPHPTGTMPFQLATLED